MTGRFFTCLMYYLTDHPHFVEPDVYERELQDMATRIRQIPSLRSLYQIGSVSTPGISDLDLVAVFADGSTVDTDPTAELTDSARYLFIHKIYGCSESQLAKAWRFSAFQTHRLLAGERLPDVSPEPPPGDEIRTQLTLEYLVKLFINLSLQKEYRVIKVRSVLLHVKACLEDLEWLKAHGTELHTETLRLIGWRADWFRSRLSDKEFVNWFLNYLKLLTDFLDSQLKQRGFYAPHPAPVTVGRNLRLVAGDSLFVRREGSNLSFLRPFFGKKYSNLMNRLNRFNVYVPLRESVPSGAIKDYFDFLSSLKEHNRNYLPEFYPLASSLKL